MTLAEAFTEWRTELLTAAEGMMAERFAAQQRHTRVVNVPLVLGARATPLQIGDHVFLRLGLNGAATILTWSIAATVGGVSQVGSCVLDVQAGSTLATTASICGTNRPTLAAAAELNDQPPTDWQVTIPDPSWVLVRVDSADGVLEVVGLTLRVIVGIDANALVVGTETEDIMTSTAGDTFVFGG